jgi:hypothetical protein
VILCVLIGSTGRIPTLALGTTQGGSAAMIGYPFNIVACGICARAGERIAALPFPLIGCQSRRRRRPRRAFMFSP